jgi:hypothetical protein
MNQDHMDTSVNFSCQIHVATGVLLDLGGRSNQQPLKNTQRKTTRTQLQKAKIGQASFQKPVKLTLTIRGNRSGCSGKLVRPVLSRKSLKGLRDQTSKTISRIQPAGKTQASPWSISWFVRRIQVTLGIAGVPRGIPLARSSVPKTYPIKRNRKSTHKNNFLRTPPKPPNRAPLLTNLGGESKGKEPRRVHAYIPHQIAKKKASKSPQ